MRRGRSGTIPRRRVLRAWGDGVEGGSGRRRGAQGGGGDRCRGGGAAGDEGRTRGTGIGRGPIRIGARGRKGIGGRSGCG